LSRRLSGRRFFFRAGTRAARIARVHRPNPPSIDPGVMAFIWALLLALYVYFGLKAIGATSATSIFVALLAFAGIWLFVRLRGEDRPGA
jgi:purine-cytosine permease-like protein